MYNIKKQNNTIRDLIKIRVFEEKLLDLFSMGKINGTTHTCVGQEEIPVAVMSLLNENDYIFSNHRGHGHYLARFKDEEGLFAEIMGKEGAVCNGVGGSQHIKRDHYLSTGIQGESVPVAVGVALNIKIEQKSDLALVFIGDGTWGQGAVYEALNMASLWEVPLVIVCENNDISQTTPSSLNLSSNIEKRSKAFDIDYILIENNSMTNEITEILAPAFKKVRKSSKPLIVEIKTKRLLSHSKGDDTRNEKYIQDLKNNDWYEKLVKTYPKEILKIRSEIETSLDELINNILLRDFVKKNNDLENIEVSYSFDKLIFKKESVLSNLNSAINSLMEKDSNVFFIGEDILDPYGGAFKVSKGLSTKFKDRVISTPISELGLTGVGNGLVLSGKKAIVEFMFGDFIFLAFDQIINFSAKTVSMYGEKILHPIIFRCPVGGHRGYGPTHSQSVQKFFMGIPNLLLFELSPCHNTIEILPNILKNGIPSILFESKTLYAKKTIEIGKFKDLFIHEKLNKMTSRIYIDDEIDLILICGGSVLYDCLDVSEKLFMNYEISTHIINPFCIYPFEVDVIENLIKKPNFRIFSVEEGTIGGSWGSEVCSLINEKFQNIKVKAVQICSKDQIIPSSKHLESEMLLSSDQIIDTILKNLDK